MYRLTRKADSDRRAQLAAMRAAKERKRLESPAPDYPAKLPDLRMRITIERLDFGREAHVIELHRTRRIDVYRATVDGQPWITAGLTHVLSGIRKACPRVLSPRSR